MRNNFRIDGSLPNSSSNDLGVLRAEIKNENSFGAILGGTGTLCLQEHYFTDSAKIVKRDRSICSQSYLSIWPNLGSPPAAETLSLASLRLPRPCRGSRGFGPLRPTPAHFQFLFHDGMDVRLRGEIGPPKTHSQPNRISHPACGILPLASVRSRGFEPPWVAPLPPQGSASASFATSA